jgi:hypothetical protein
MPFNIYMSPMTPADELALERETVARRLERASRRRSTKAERRQGVALLALGVFVGIVAAGAVLDHAWSGPMDYAKPHAVTARWVDEDGPEIQGSCDTDAECAELPSCKRDPTCDGGPVNGPRRALLLVGVGCGPDRVIMVAAEEDEFPVRCESIEAHYLPTNLGR